MEELTPADKQRLGSFINCFVERPILTTILRDFDRLRFNRELGGEPQCMLLTGDTGSGKTHLINYYKEKFPSLRKGDTLIKPLLVSRIPSKLNLEQMMIQMLSDLGQFGSEYRRGRSRDIGLTEALVKTLKRCKTELIIINEFQEILEFKSIRDRQIIANRLKMISEEAEIPIVLVGMPWAEQIAEEPQWASRLICRRMIPYFKLSDGPEEFIRFLKGLAVRMPFEKLPRLEEKQIALALFAYSRGEVRRLKKLLDEAVKIAVVESADTLRSDHLIRAYECTFPGAANPFKEKVEYLKFSEVSSYSKYQINAASDEEALVATQFLDSLSLSEILKKS
ncbi:AAA domain-containing protein [Modicisalibacter muralis]|uniref:AAA domain-containing protein n=1 Tax=Modicisalibacter muralis TaxID=119000 RepID=A0A1G9LNA0_9GAMM|nr:TniB family NTP-binding protein [Halomonas muralis]SDL63400.1 AAA domain-containing protein [Halomonas muralis]